MHMDRLIWAFAVHTCLEDSTHKIANSSEKVIQAKERNNHVLPYSIKINMDENRL